VKVLVRVVWGLAVVWGRVVASEEMQLPQE
jgi:hypothetical protein